MFRRPSLSLIAVVLWLLTFGVAHAQIALLDPTFGDAGRIIGIDFPDYYTNFGGEVLALQNGQFIVTVGIADGGLDEEDVGLIRYNGNGTIDTTFGDGGYVIIDWDDDGGEDWVSGGLALDRRGRIVVVGSTYKDNRYQFAVAMVNGAGNLEPTFGEGGKTVPIRFFNSSKPTSVSIDLENRILITGVYGADENFGYSFLLRMTENGDLDEAIDMTGVREYTAAAVDYAGRYVWADAEVTGQGLEVATIRIFPDGSDDLSFDEDGLVYDIVDDSAYPGIVVRQVLIQSDNKIVIVGGDCCGFHAWRYDDDGLDTSFGDDGRMSFEMPLSELTRATLDSQNRILMAGFADTGDSYDFVLTRLTANGQKDSTFGLGGVMTLDMDTLSAEVLNGMALMPDGDVILGGKVNGAVAVGLARVALGNPAVLMSNSGFETADAAQASGASKWVGANLTKDKRNCAAVNAHTGSCSFVFKGSINEKATITQTLKPNAIYKLAGTALTLSAWAKGSPNMMLIAKVSLTYTDGSRDAFSMGMLPTPTYSEFVSAPFILPKQAKTIKVSFKHFSSSGTLYLDDVMLQPNTIRLRDATLPLPPPESPVFRSIGE